MKAKLWGKVFLIGGFAMLMAGLFFVISAQAGTTFHGVGIRKTCESPSKAGDKTDCQIQVSYLDEAGDTLTVQQGFDVVDPSGDAVRVPGSGNLPIVAVSGNTDCAVGGSLPCRLGPDNGEQDAGTVTFRQNSYVVKADDPNPLVDQGTAVVKDECDAEKSPGCSTIPNTVQFTASVNLVYPGLSVEKSSDCVVQDNSITYTIRICNTGDVKLNKKGVVDSLLGNISGQFGPSLEPEACETVEVPYTLQGNEPDTLVNQVGAAYQVDRLPNVLKDTATKECDLDDNGGGGGGRRRRSRDREVAPASVSPTTTIITTTTVAAETEVTPQPEELPFTGFNEIWLLFSVSFVFILAGAGLLILA